MSRYRGIVITVSTRASKGIWEDTTGPVISSTLNELGIATPAPIVIPDGEAVEQTLREQIQAGANLIITTGGTGHSPTDFTPEMTMRVLDRQSPGIAEAIRAYGVAQGVATASLSRAVAGISGKTLIINLPGSMGGVKDGMTVLRPILLHALDQIDGGDHTRVE
jgi:molybdenum cofactor synthesis domain-containing protein